jgi:hypothetical protein
MEDEKKSLRRFTMPWKWILILVVALAIGFGAVVSNNSGTKADFLNVQKFKEGSNTKTAN